MVKDFLLQRCHHKHFCCTVFAVGQVKIGEKWLHQRRFLFEDYTTLFAKRLL